MQQELENVRHSLLYAGTKEVLDAGPLLGTPEDSMARRSSASESEVADLMLQETFARYWHKTAMESQREFR